MNTKEAAKYSASVIARCTHLPPPLGQFLAIGLESVSFSTTQTFWSTNANADLQRQKARLLRIRVLAHH